MSSLNKPVSRLDMLLDRVPVLGDVLRRPMGLLGFLLVFAFLIIVIFAPAIAPYHYAELDVNSRFQGPSANYILGTDHLGRDLFSRLIYGSQIALGTAVPSVAIAITIGIVLGLISGYIGGRVDSIILVIMNSAQSFPAIVLALAILALLGPSLFNVVIVIGVTWTPNYARVVRAQVLSVREAVYVEAERSLGASDFRILTSHILPNVVAPVLLLAAMDLPWVITFEAGLSFLGLGVRPPSPSWGVILSDGFSLIRQSVWPVVWSGLFLILTTLGFTLFGEALRDVLDPKMSGRRPQ
ncbi:MAG: ABC transporter permease [Oscillospiraceae bacterium]|nr:ABC transporter permease [Oscillospiraceae bacterium]